MPANPAIITYDKERKDKFYEKWDQFLSEYECRGLEMIFNPNIISSYLGNVYITDKDKPRIFRDTLSCTDTAVVFNRITHFVDKWEDLFGCDANNLEIEEISFGDEGSINVRFIQKKINGIPVNILYDRSLYISLDCYGFLSGIRNDLIPDVYLEIPPYFNKEKILENITSQAVYGEWSQLYILNENDNFRFKDGYSVLTKYEGNAILIYVVKAVEYLQNVDYREEPWIPFTIYCHPLTGEIMYVGW
ncbi:hypothetical protein ACFL4T_00170 [candidate division KSB1 bacterium]